MIVECVHDVVELTEENCLLRLSVTTQRKQMFLAKKRSLTTQSMSLEMMTEHLMLTRLKTFPARMDRS